MSNSWNIDLQTAKCTITPITGRQYYVFFQHSLEIRTDNLFYFDLYDAINRVAPDLTEAKLYASLKMLFGDSTTMYDYFKCSFGYLFLLLIHKKQSHTKYILNLTDTKGGLSFKFNKIVSKAEYKKYDPNKIYEPFSKEFSNTEIRKFITYSLFSIIEFWRQHYHSFSEPFTRFRLYDHVIYSFQNNTFFNKQYISESYFHKKLNKLENENIIINKNRSNELNDYEISIPLEVWKWFNRILQEIAGKSMGSYFPERPFIKEIIKLFKEKHEYADCC